MPICARRGSPRRGTSARTSPPWVSTASEAKQNNSSPTVRGPKPNLFSAQIAKIDSSIDCELVTSSVAHATNRRDGRSRSSRNALDRARAACSSRNAAVLLSGRTNATSPIANRLRTSRHHRGANEVGRGDVVARQDAADSRTHGEADADRRADQPQRCGPIAGLAHIRCVSERGGDVARHEAAQHARRDQPPDVVRQAEHDVRDTRAAQARHQDHAPSVAVAEASPHGRRQELEQRISAENRGDPLRGHAEAIAHVGHQRDEDAEPQDVDDADEEESQQSFVQNTSV